MSFGIMMKILFLTMNVVLFFLASSAFADHSPLPLVSELAAAHIDLSFDEEFSGTNINTDVWSPTFLGGQVLRPADQAFYTPSAVSQDNGNLELTADRLEDTNDQTGHRPYTSGVLASFPKRSLHPGFQQLYGVFEIKARVPNTHGVLASFWMKSVRGWPPEIDVFEIWGQNPGMIEQTNHWKDEEGKHQADGTRYKGINASGDFHIYTIDWEPGYIKWYVDGVQTAMHTDGIPDQPLFLILQLTVKPAGRSGPNESSVFPAHYDIQYVRVWK
jgi:beta-glucanase (GH16 family)